MINNDSDNDTLEVTIIFAADDNDSSISKDTFLFHGLSLVIPLSIFMIAFMILAIGGNVMVILTIIRHRGMRTRTNIFIINLAIADILVAILDMPFSLATVLEGDWIFGDGMCKFNGFTMALFLICSIHTLMYIAVHKYVSITKPFSRVMTPRRIKLMIAATWLWSILCALGPLVGWNSIGYKMGASQCGPNIPKDFLAVSHSLFITTTNYLIPLGVMSFCYGQIFKEIKNHIDRIQETSNINLASSIQQQKKVSITLLLVLACFIICWTPYMIYSTCAAFLKDKKKMPSYINPLVYWFGYMNSACNPIIYAFRSPSFRQGYKEIMCGRPVPGLSGANSQVITSSASVKKCQIVNNRGNDKRKRRRTKKMLSQTSWISLPIMPFLRRSFSSSTGASHRAKDEEERQQYSQNVAQWGHCMCCSSDLSNDETEDEGERYNKGEDKPSLLNGPELNTLNIGEDICPSSTDDEMSNQHMDVEDVEIVGDYVVVENGDEVPCGEASDDQLSNPET